MLMLTSLVVLATVVAPEPSNEDADAQARVGQTSEYKFEDEELDGQVLTAEGALIQTRTSREHASLIQLRRTFTDQLLVLSREI